MGAVVTIGSIRPMSERPGSASFAWFELRNSILILNEVTRLAEKIVCVIREAAMVEF